MKKWLAILLLLVVLPCALAEETADDRFAGIPENSYNELSADEIPEGELTEKLLEDLQEIHADRLFDSILPLLQDRGYLPAIHRHAFLNAEGNLWKVETDSFWDLYRLVDTLPAEELPGYYVHLSPDCDPETAAICNYFAIYFFSLENMFHPCPECFPLGWQYEYLVSPADAMPALNQMTISPFAELAPGRFDQIEELLAYFDKETDECLFIAAEYYGQGYVIIWQAEDFELFETVSHCELCDKGGYHFASWAHWMEGPAFCRNCGELSPASVPYIPE